MSKLKYYSLIFAIILISYNFSDAKPIIQPYNSQLHIMIQLLLLAVILALKAKEPRSHGPTWNQIA